MENKYKFYAGATKDGQIMVKVHDKYEFLTVEEAYDAVSAILFCISAAGEVK